MKIMKPIRKTSASISLMLSLLLLGQGFAPLMVSAYWVTVEFWVDGYMDTYWVNGYYSGTNWVNGFEAEIWVPGYADTRLEWVPDDGGSGDDDGSGGSTTEPIDTATGNNYFTESRLYVPASGIPLELNLKYQSITNASAGSLGQGWRHNYEWMLDVQTNAATLHTGTGYRIAYKALTNGLYQMPEGSKWELDPSGNGYEIRFPGGKTYRFDSSGQLDALEDVWGNEVVCFRGTNGCLEGVEHSNGRKLVFSNQWDSILADWRVSSIRVPGGAALEFSYNADGQFTQVVEQVGLNSYTSSYQYADGYLTNKVNGAGFEYSFGYEEVNGTLNGRGTHLEVDGYYEHDVDYVNESTTDVTYRRSGENQVFRYARDASGMLTTIHGPGGTVSEAFQQGRRFGYATNRVDKIESTVYDTSTGASWSRWMQYDDAHNLTNLSTSYGSANPVPSYSLEYDPQWQTLCATEEPDGSLTQIEYANGSPQIIKAFHSPTSSYDTHLAYTTNGLIQGITNANGHVSAFDYDSVGNLISKTPAAGPQVTNCYNSLGFMTRMEILSESGASTGRQYEYEPDAHGRTTRIIHPDGLATERNYNALGYLTQSIDRAGRTTDYTYAPTEKLTSMTRYLGEGGSNTPVRTGFDLDEQVNVLRIAEPRGRYVESYQLDIQDRVVAVTNIEGQVMDIDYTVGNFVDTITRFDGSTVSNAYDQAGRLSYVGYSSASVPLASIAYSHYPDGALKKMSDPSGSVSNRYDQLNRLTYSRVRRGDPDEPTQSVTYTLDPVGNRTQTSIFAADSDGFPWHFIDTTYTYDAAERLKTSDDQVYTYNPENGRVASVSNTVSGITCSYQYGLMDRTTNIAYRTSDGTLICGLEYEYDAASMIAKKTIHGGVSSTSTAYTYDSLDRLVAEQRTAGVSPAQSQSYTYDLAGNRLSKTSNGWKTDYTLGIGNRLASSSSASNTTLFVSGSSSELIGSDNRWGTLSISNLTTGASVIPNMNGNRFFAQVPALGNTTNRVVAAIRDQAGNMGYATSTYWVDINTGGTSSGSSYAYNVAGCLTNLNGVALEWDERYRLKSVKSAQSVDISYTYDPAGRRLSRTAGTSVEYYVYDGSHIVADLDANKNLLRTYSYGPGIDNILTMTRYSGNHATAKYHYIKDHQNTVIALANTSGTVVESYEYDAYGNIRVFNGSGTEIQQSAIGNRYTFQGREIDWTTDLMYFRARWYNPETGRWLSKDPIGISGGLNQYVFVDNNPVNFVDPMGLCTESGNGWDDLKNVYKNGKSDWSITIDLVLGVGFQLNINNKGGSVLPAKGLMAGVGLGANRSLENQGAEKTLNVGVLFGGASVSKDSASGDLTGYGTSAGKGLSLGVSQTQEGEGYGRNWEW